MSYFWGGGVCAGTPGYPGSGSDAGWRMERFAPAPLASLRAPRWQRGRRCRAGFSPGSGEVRVVGTPLLPPPQIPGGFPQLYPVGTAPSDVPAKGWGGENRAGVKK